DVVHVPLKGAPEMVAETLAGRTHFGLVGITAVLPALRDRRILALAVSSVKRSPALPEVPPWPRSACPPPSSISGSACSPPRRPRERSSTGSTSRSPARCRRRRCWSGSPTSARSRCRCDRSNSTPTCASNWRASAACCAAPASRPIEKLRARMKVIAIEEHFITPMYREKVRANEFRNIYLKSRGEQLGHDIVEQNSDLGAGRLAHMDAAGVDVQVLSFGSPGPQAFAAEVAIPMARDANDRLYQAIQKHPGRFAGF